jgi:hypothetical protein
MIRTTIASASASAHPSVELPVIEESPFTSEDQKKIPEEHPTDPPSPPPPPQWPTQGGGGGVIPPTPNAQLAADLKSGLELFGAVFTQHSVKNTASFPR